MTSESRNKQIDELIETGYQLLELIEAKPRSFPITSFNIWLANVDQFFQDNFNEKNSYRVLFSENVANEKRIGVKHPTYYHIQLGIETLKALSTYLERNPEYSEPKQMAEQDINKLAITPKDLRNRKIFVVHGQNEEVKNQVEQFLSSLGLEPIILHKQPDLGKTLIEKMEHYSDVSFCVVLLTADDFGGNVDRSSIEADFKQRVSQFKQPLDMSTQAGQVVTLAIVMKTIQNVVFKSIKPRARQNVIFEFGYFIGLLGRENVRALYQENVDLPSDIQGVLYIPLDKEEKWKNKLKKEIISSGIPIR